MKRSYIVGLFLGTTLLWVKAAYAVCPICTIAVGAGVGLAEWLGIDDTITGFWIGGLTLSLILWTFAWLDKKQIDFVGRNTFIVLIYYLMIVVPLYFVGIIGRPDNILWGIDKLLLGIILGSVFFLAGAMWYIYLKKRHNNRAYFPFQKVVMPVAPLIVLSVIFYLITR